MAAMQRAACAPQRWTHRLPLVRLARLVAVASAAGAWAQVPDSVVTRRSSADGAVTLVTTSDGKPIPSGVRSANAAAAPLDFLREYASAFGIADAAQQLRQVKAHVDELGFTHTTFEQVHEGVHVFSGELRVHQNRAGAVTAANGRFHDGLTKVSTTPALNAETAMDYAAAAMPALTQPVGAAELVIVDPAWYGDPGRGPQLAYHFTLANDDGTELEAFFVSAQTGEIIDHWSQVCHARHRQIYDGSNGYSYPGTLMRSEGEPPSGGHPDINRAYDYYGDVYDYYSRAFGRDSIDGFGMPMVAIVNSKLPGCPNAGWYGSPYNLMIFCPGLVVDDVVAHELTHGVTENTAALIYQNQSGQLNEAFSDIFGELVDLFNGDAAFLDGSGGATWPTHPTGTGTDTPNHLRSACSTDDNNYSDGVRWLMGEDSSMGGAIRDMWLPGCFDQPDSANALLQRCQPYDGGGVHYGSGVLLHAFAMATDGATFNGHTITGIGPIKTGAVYYRALSNYLVSVSDFEDAYYLINRAAQDLIGTTPKDPRTGSPSGSVFTAADAQQIDEAMLAVELNTPGRCGVQPLLDPDEPVTCTAPAVIYSADFESGQAGWQTENNSSLSPANNWARVSELPDGRPGTAWFATDPNVDCAGGVSASGVRRLISPTINLPAGAAFPTLKFTHLVQIEPYWDGGILSLKVNGGAWTVIPPTAFVFNPYNLRALYTEAQGSENPLAGMTAFSGWGGQWGTSVVDLRGLAAGGDQIQIRFEIGTDYCEGLHGWYIDDFVVYDCPNALDCNDNGIPDEAEINLGPLENVLSEQTISYSGLVALGVESDLPYDTFNVAKSYAEDLYVPQAQKISAVRIWGGYRGTSPGHNDFNVRVHQATAGGLPGQVVGLDPNKVTATWTPMGIIHGGVTIWQIDLQLAAPVALAPGYYFIEVYRAATIVENFYWEIANYEPDLAFYAYATSAPGQLWMRSDDANVYPVNLGMKVFGPELGDDCNTNGVPDDCDIASAQDSDCNANGTPDFCEPFVDCNNNGIQDLCETDCNFNGIADSCDVSAGSSTDCDGNGTPDECQHNTDCNGNGAIDICDISAGAADCDANHQPDSCQADADGDHTIDPCDGCPQDANKTSAGVCGCGVSDKDTDGDKVPDCKDRCPGADDRIDTDKDGTPNCADECPNDKNQIKAGQCGCGNPEHDPDRDGVASCIDNCPMNANASQADVDSDGLGDMCDGCPADAAKTSPGVCGCGLADVDSDDDGLYDCADPCPQDPTTNNTDTDHDGVGDACDDCPFDLNKSAPGICGCGHSDADSDFDGVANCLDNCPGTPVGTAVNEAGCPVNQTPPPQPTPGPDTDGDGVADEDDECPDTPTGVSVNAVGCPTATPEPSIQDPTCGSIGVVSMIVLGLGLVGMRQRMR